MLSKRNSLDEPQVLGLSSTIQLHVLSSPRFRNALSIGAYFPFGTEVRTEMIMEEARKLGKKVSLPTVEGTDIAFYEFSSSKYLVKGRFGVMEPLPYGRSTDLDLLIVPGIAFDKSGSRLGYGKAYYDRYLAKSAAYSIGMAYSFQISDRLPQHEHDVKLKAVATEKGLMTFDA
jgi:5-formyltetrahydrofolate cyclo-ligase